MYMYCNELLLVLRVTMIKYFAVDRKTIFAIPYIFSCSFTYFLRYTIKHTIRKIWNNSFCMYLSRGLIGFVAQIKDRSEMLLNLFFIVSHLFRFLRKMEFINDKDIRIHYITLCRNKCYSSKFRRN